METNSTKLFGTYLSQLLKELPFLDSQDSENVSFEGKKVFLRADFNVPLDLNNNLIDDGRLRKTLPTINYLLDRGSAVIVAGHLRKPDGKVVEEWSLKPFARRLSRLWGVDIKFSPNLTGPENQKMAKNLKPGEIILLENLRFHPGENNNDENFAKYLASLADYYVNDAFGACHRNCASMVSILKYSQKCFAGFQLKTELTVLKRALSDPTRPLLAIIGGMGAEAKLPAVKNFLNAADYVLLAGTLGDIFSRILYNIPFAAGTNLAEENKKETQKILKLFFEHKFKAKLFLPIDAVAFNVTDKTDTITTTMQDLNENYKMTDIGPATRILFEEVIKKAKTVVWNGPLGAFEEPQFSHGTSFLAKTLANLNAITLAGGVKTSTALFNMGETAKLSFLSTGGGAFLKILSNQALVALEVLRKVNKG